MATPLTIPTSAPTPRQITTVSPTGSPAFVIIYAPIIPESPTVEPTEISISPKRIAISIPQLIIAFTALDLNRFKRFEAVRNLGVETEMITTKRIRPIIVPIFLLKKAMPGIDPALFLFMSRPPDHFIYFRLFTFCCKRHHRFLGKFRLVNFSGYFSLAHYIASVAHVNYLRK